MGKRAFSWTLRGLLKTVVLLVCASGLALLVVRASAARVFASQPNLLSAINPNDPDLVFREAARELQAMQGRISPEMMARVEEASRRQPLSASPFLYNASRALLEGDAARAERLLHEGQRRDPRNRLVRLLKLPLYLTTNRVEEAVQEVAVIVRLVPQANQQLVGLLAPLAKSSKSRAAVIRGFGADPLMGLLLDQLVDQGASPELLLELSQRQPPRPGAGAKWQTTILDKLIARGDVGRARAVWTQFAGGAAAGDGLVYDGRFQGLPGGPPFNWSLVSNNVGVAERSSGPALAVEFFGRVAGTLAEQLLTLSPGRYRLAFRAEGKANAQGSKLLWRVKCRGDGPTLLELPLENITFAPKEFGAELTVPASCSSQQLQLAGVTAEFPTTQSVRISELSIRPAGRAAR
jgi:hypothetical protein